MNYLVEKYAMEESIAIVLDANNSEHKITGSHWFITKKERTSEPLH
jgi:hypothetical protein